MITMASHAAGTVVNIDDAKFESGSKPKESGA